ncbi:MAG: cytochrome c oxidase accessory protein CcoG, partial [Thiotrichales bacterium]|nr:cytochrome c oxidase accessory protein CcoG [Thiotrichales bacterium]
RLWCGYFCFHTVWTDVFTWIEEKIEGQPNKRQKLDAAPISWEKIRIKLPKHFAWLLIGFATSFSFVAYFTDALDLWARLFRFEWGSVETGVIVGLGLATYFFAGFLREQTCIGFCPYARIQGAMIDTQTVVPTYDQDRGEPRGRVKRVKPGEASAELGDCIDCNLCVAVCPTGVDIRRGQQFGCITCGLCIDACDSVMDKLKKPRGLIRYASLQEFTGKTLPAIWKRPRVLVYSAIMAFAAGAILFGLATMSPLDVKALHERSPLFVQMSDGSIQNKWTLKIVNKGSEVLRAKITVQSAAPSMQYDVSDTLQVQPGTVGSTTLLVKIPRKEVDAQNMPLKIVVEDLQNPAVRAVYDSAFIGPKPR